MHTGCASRWIAEAVPSQADVILYYINCVLQDEPPLDELRIALRRTTAVTSPTRDEQ